MRVCSPPRCDHRTPVASLPGQFGCPAARLPGCPAARLPGCPAARLPVGPPGCPAIALSQASRGSQTVRADDRRAKGGACTTRFRPGLFGEAQGGVRTSDHLGSGVLAAEGQTDADRDFNLVVGAFEWSGCDAGSDSFRAVAAPPGPRVVGAPRRRTPRPSGRRYLRFADSHGYGSDTLQDIVTRVE